MDKYIFRDSVLPSARQLTDAWEELFVLEDWHNFGTDYCKTLLSWHDNFKKNWPGIAADYGRRFYRMWTYYLLVCAASFHARRSQLWQIVLAKGGMPEGYTAPR
jgi:cyclopropane-fatty-acyl-phospholipid synthase